MSAMRTWFALTAQVIGALVASHPVYDAASGALRAKQGAIAEHETTGDVIAFLRCLMGAISL